MTTNELHVRVRDRGGTAVVDLQGEINRSGDERLAQAYRDATADGARTVVLNFERTEYINSTGIALIVGLLAQARKQGVHVSACGLSEHYREIFEITRLADFMTIADSEDGAVRGADRSHDD